jgi:hypothetical protein
MNIVAVPMLVLYRGMTKYLSHRVLENKMLGPETNQYHHREYSRQSRRVPRSGLWGCSYRVLRVCRDLYLRLWACGSQIRPPVVSCRWDRAFGVGLNLSVARVSHLGKEPHSRPVLGIR